MYKNMQETLQKMINSIKDEKEGDTAQTRFGLLRSQNTKSSNSSTKTAVNYNEPVIQTLRLLTSKLTKLISAMRSSMVSNNQHPNTPNIERKASIYSEQAGKVTFSTPKKNNRSVTQSVQIDKTDTVEKSTSTVDWNLLFTECKCEVHMTSVDQKLDRILASISNGLSGNMANTNAIRSRDLSVSHTIPECQQANTIVTSGIDDDDYFIRQIHIRDEEIENFKRQIKEIKESQQTIDKKQQLASSKLANKVVELERENIMLKADKIIGKGMNSSSCSAIVTIVGTETILLSSSIDELMTTKDRLQSLNSETNRLGLELEECSNSKESLIQSIKQLQNQIEQEKASSKNYKERYIHLEVNSIQQKAEYGEVIGCIKKLLSTLSKSASSQKVNLPLETIQSDFKKLIDNTKDIDSQEEQEALNYLKSIEDDNSNLDDFLNIHISLLLKMIRSLDEESLYRLLEIGRALHLKSN